MALLVSRSRTSNGDCFPSNNSNDREHNAPLASKQEGISRLSMSEPHHSISPRLHIQDMMKTGRSIDTKMDDDDDLPVSTLTYGAPSPAHMAKMPNIVSPMAVFHANSFGAKSYDEADLPLSSKKKKQQRWKQTKAIS
mmetsp:Transcript_26976/g.41359  ORF Transcript_26976/g.41359 Transcript_26976/m.41359 type:complete len:138 (-) Transcript_26976:2886-3299(-)